MERRTVIKLRDRPTLIKETAEWFASKWHLPVAVYEESIQASTRKNTSVPQWYVVLNEWGEIIAGGVLAAVNLILSILIYLPFVKVATIQERRKEALDA